MTQVSTQSLIEEIAVPTERLRWRCDPATLGFASTDEVPPLVGTVGQDRGIEAIRFGLSVDTDGFNVYVAGPSGTGRATSTRALIAELASARSAPSDWCYLHNFSDPTQPVAVELAAGQGSQLARDLAELITDARREIPRVFEGEQYQRRRAEIMQQLQSQREALLDQVHAEAERLSFAVEFTPMGVATVPLLEPGKPLSQEAFELLPDEKKAQLRLNSQELTRKTEEVLVVVRRMERQAHEQLQALDREAVSFAVGHLLGALRAKYTDTAAVVQHLEAVQTDLVEHLDDFRSAESPSDNQSAPPKDADRAFDRYRANLLVAHDPWFQPKVRRWSSSPIQPITTCSGASITGPPSARCTPIST